MSVPQTNPPICRLTPRAVVYLTATLLLLVLLALSPIFSNAFTTFDDDIWIGKNQALNPPSFRGLLAKWADPFDRSTPGVFQALYSPLTHTLWYPAALLAARGTPDGLGIALDPVPFRALSLSVHLLAVGGVLALAHRVKQPLPVAILAAATFALHPMQVEAVAWASGLKDLLWTALVAWGLAAWVGYLTSPRPRLAIAALVLGALALLAKPTAVVFPAMLFWAWLCLRPTAPPFPFRRVAPFLAAATLAAIPIAIVTALFQSGVTVPPVAPWQRPLVALDALGHYVATLIYPVGLTIDYARTPAWTVEAWRWAPNALLAAVTFVTLGLLRDRVLWFGTGTAVLAVAPVLGLKDFDYATFTVVTDHYGYAWMLGAAVVLARVAHLAFTRLAQRLPPTPLLRAAATLAIAVALTWAALAYRQAAVWRDSASLYLHCLRVQPRSAIVNSNYASHLYVTAKTLPLEQRQPLIAAMRTHAGKALQTWPDFPQAHYLSGMANAILGEPREALRHYVRAATYYAKHADFQVKVADVYAELGRLEDAERHYREALRLDPDQPAAARMLARIAAERARTTPSPQLSDEP